MNRSEALAERDRLRGLLAAYDDHRTASEADDHGSRLPQEITPDRAAKVRARIANLDDIIASDGD